MYRRLDLLLVLLFTAILLLKSLAFPMAHLAQRVSVFGSLRSLHGPVLQLRRSLYTKTRKIPYLLQAPHHSTRSLACQDGTSSSDGALSSDESLSLTSVFETVDETRMCGAHVTVVRAPSGDIFQRNPSTHYQSDR